ncbi:MAG: hypothetical protein QNK37_18855 [Acidobacteriota bacterium]|nr:hypothetical protein [Acidobacteriota bacterium]
MKLTEAQRRRAWSLKNHSGLLRLNKEQAISRRERITWCPGAD